MRGRVRLELLELSVQIRDIAAKSSTFTTSLSIFHLPLLTQLAQSFFIFLELSTLLL